MVTQVRIDILFWDDWNREHIAKHGVVIEEVEQVAKAYTSIVETYKSRYQLIGVTQAGRILSVIIGAVPGRENCWYVFSARPASRKERRLNELMRGGPDGEET